MRKTMLVVACVAVAMLVAGGVAWAATIQCGGNWVRCNGTNQADTMKGNGGHNLMFGKGGGDTMHGYGARDYLNGGPGSDKVNSGSGGSPHSLERALGGPGSDSLYGGDGFNSLIGGLGSDKLYGGPEGDALRTGVASASRPPELDASDDVAYGGSGTDGFHYSWSRAGVEHLYGEGGNDIFHVNTSDTAVPVTKEIVDCGPGSDTVYFDEGVDVVMDNCETLHDHYPLD